MDCVSGPELERHARIRGRNGGAHVGTETGGGAMRMTEAPFGAITHSVPVAIFVYHSRDRGHYSTIVN